MSLNFYFHLKVLVHFSNTFIFGKELTKKFKSLGLCYDSKSLRKIRKDCYGPFTFVKNRIILIASLPNQDHSHWTMIEIQKKKKEHSHWSIENFSLSQKSYFIYSILATPFFTWTCIKLTLFLDF